MNGALLRKAVYLVCLTLVLALLLASGALAQETMMEETTVSGAGAAGPLAPSGGPGILIPAAALILGSGILTYAILRRRG
ncbi:hypothetical protein [Rubrobacter xylanophilus]|jgi:TRAP-type C4-dicarboxylate transport system permease small subunit|nr:hypothetical protein [Rubrobacter xylanophilus]